MWFANWNQNPPPALAKDKLPPLGSARGAFSPLARADNSYSKAVVQPAVVGGDGGPGTSCQRVRGWRIFSAGGRKKAEDTHGLGPQSRNPRPDIPVTPYFWKKVATKPDDFENLVSLCERQPRSYVSSDLGCFCAHKPRGSRQRKEAMGPGRSGCAAWF